MPVQCLNLFWWNFYFEFFPILHCILLSLGSFLGSNLDTSEYTGKYSRMVQRSNLASLKSSGECSMQKAHGCKHCILASDLHPNLWCYEIIVLEFDTFPCERNKTFWVDRWEIDESNFSEMQWRIVLRSYGITEMKELVFLMHCSVKTVSCFHSLWL